MNPTADQYGNPVQTHAAQAVHTVGNLPWSGAELTMLIVAGLMLCLSGYALWRASYGGVE